MFNFVFIGFELELNFDFLSLRPGVLNLLVLAYPQITNCTKIVPPKKTKVIFVQLIIFLAIAIFAIPNFFSELNSTTCSFC